MHALLLSFGAGALTLLVSLLLGRPFYAYRTFESYPAQVAHFFFWLGHGLRYRYPDARIKRITLLPTGHLFVLDRQGNRMPQYAGSVQDKKVLARIQAARGRVPILIQTGARIPLMHNEKEKHS